MLGWLLNARKVDTGLVSHVADWGEWRRVTEADGTLHAFSRAANVTVMPDGRTRLFIRTAIVKNMQTGRTRTRRMVVAELDGVRLYVLEGKLLLSTADHRITDGIGAIMTPLPPRDGNVYTHGLKECPLVKLTMTDGKLILHKRDLA